MKKALVAGPARRDLDTIWRYIARESRSLQIAGTVVDSITDSFPLLARSAEIGRRRDDFGPGVRRFPAGNYQIYYRIKGLRVHILRAIHGRRSQKPAYFRRSE